VTANLMVIRGGLTVANAFPQVINDLFIAREIGVRATGPHTLQIELLFSTGYLPSLLSTPEFRPLPREAVTAAQDWTRPSTILTSGPYALQSWTSEGMVLVKNPFWPAPFTGGIERVSVSFTDDANSAASLAAASRVDFARLSATELQQAQAIVPDRLHIEQGATLTVLGFSFERAMVGQPEVRRALATALEKSTLAAEVFGDEMIPATAFTPTGMVGSPANISPNAARDNALARSHYEAAGYPNCAGMPEPITLWVADDDPRWLSLGQAIASQWAEALGCNPNLFKVETVSRTLLIELAHSTYDAEKLTRPHAWLGTWSADYPDANAWLNDALHCRYGYFRVGRACDAADDLLDRAGSEADIPRRIQLYEQVEQLFFAPQSGSFPVIPLLFSINAWLQAPALGNVNAATAARFDTWTLSGAE
jgi:oligopeptide transport system substrate-binding protein